jgi:hypothetical protein
MIQQVNLYQDALKTKTTSDLNNYLYGIALVALLFLGFSIYLLIDQNNTEANIQQAHQQLSDAESHVQLMQEQYPEQQVDTFIQQEISRYENILSSLSQVVYLLSDNESDQTQGFSRYLSALARQSSSDIWLTEISIDAERNYLSLHGSTFNTKTIPEFLQKLHHEAVFKGRVFDSLNMTQSIKIKKQLDFNVSTAAKKSEEKSESNE